MFGTTFGHYLSYGASDQSTAVALAGSYDGLVVPGTIASFHRDGTSGFVISLTSLPNSPDYVIDPRFPLFQQQLPKAKKAHASLAEVLGDPTLVVTSHAPLPDDFTTARIDHITRAWLAFNDGYRGTGNKKFDKYAARLGEPVSSQNGKGPRFVLPPYFMSTGPNDPWWDKSRAFFHAAQDQAAPGVECIRVVAATTPDGLDALLAEVTDPRVVVWISNFEELVRPEADLVSYARAVRNATNAGRQVFALYGGFYSVLLSSFGLQGASHGIGFSEHRNWHELPSSGAPPARYYLPTLHRYVQPDEAQLLLEADPTLVGCACPECSNYTPLELSYHQLMRHSVHCRTNEIAGWTPLTTVGMADRLNVETEDFYDAVKYVGLAPQFEARMMRHLRPLKEIERALRSVG